MSTSGSGTGTPLTPTSTPTQSAGADACLCRTCQPETAVTSLEAWREAMCCLEPFQFWGWDNLDLRKVGHRPCKDIVHESAGRSMVGRRNIRQALLQSESEYAAALGYSPVKRWFSEQLQPNRLLRTAQPFVIALGAPVSSCFAVADRDAQEVTFTAYTPAVGDTLTYSAKQSGAKWPDTFTLTLTVPLGLTDLSELCVYVHPDDRTEDRGNDARWKIEPIEASVNGAVLTITGRSWLLAKPSLYDVYQAHTAPTSAFNDFSLDPAWMPNYLERLQVCRCTIDQCDAGLLRSKPSCECGGCLCAFDEDGTPTHCHTCTEIDLCIENARHGLVRPIYARNSIYCVDPMTVCVHYLAGDCSRDWTRDLSILATTYLCGICACDFPCLARWWENVAQGQNKQNTFELLNNPFGTLAGHVEAWKTIERYKFQTIGTW